MELSCKSFFRPNTLTLINKPQECYKVPLDAAYCFQLNASSRYAVFTLIIFFLWVSSFQFIPRPIQQLHFFLHVFICITAFSVRLFSSSEPLILSPTASPLSDSSVLLSVCFFLPDLWSMSASLTSQGFRGATGGSVVYFWCYVAPRLWDNHILFLLFFFLLVVFNCVYLWLLLVCCCFFTFSPFLPHA